MGTPEDHRACPLGSKCWAKNVGVPWFPDHTAMAPPEPSEMTDGMPTSPSVSTGTLWAGSVGHSARAGAAARSSSVIASDIRSRGLMEPSARAASRPVRASGGKASTLPISAVDLAQFTRTVVAERAAGAGGLAPPPNPGRRDCIAHSQTAHSRAGVPKSPHEYALADERPAAVAQADQVEAALERGVRSQRNAVPAGAE